MNVSCPHCQGLMVGDGIAPGSPVLCPHCQNQFTMTAPTAPAAPSHPPLPTGPSQGPVGHDPSQGPEPTPPPGMGPAPGPAPGPGPLPGVGPAPAPSRDVGPVPSVAGPEVKAVWSDVGRRKPVDSSQMMLVGGISVLAIGIVVVLLIFMLHARPEAERGGGFRPANANIVDLAAEIRCSPTQVTVQNNDPFEWKDVVVRINSEGGKGGYSHKVVERKMLPSIYVALPYSKFTNSAGTRFDSAGEALHKVFVQANVPDVGPGQCTAVIE